MTQRQRLTLERVIRDAKSAAIEYVARQIPHRELSELRILDRHADEIAIAVVETLRRRWTVTERATGERTVP